MVVGYNPSGLNVKAEKRLTVVRDADRLTVNPKALTIHAIAKPAAHRSRIGSGWSSSKGGSRPFRMRSSG